MRKILIFSLALTMVLASSRFPRSIDLSAAHSLIQDTRLPGEIMPNNYTLDIRPNIEDSKFTGSVIIIMTFLEPTNKVVLHAGHDLEVAEEEIKLAQIGVDESIDNITKIESPAEISIRRVGRAVKKPMLEIFLHNSVKQGTIARLEISFKGTIWENAEGMFKGNYIENGIDRK
jgi:hypothetical protein